MVQIVVGEAIIYVCSLLVRVFLLPCFLVYSMLLIVQVMCVVYRFLWYFLMCFFALFACIFVCVLLLRNIPDIFPVSRLYVRNFPFHFL